MITKKYKTLNGLIRSNGARELQLDDFLNNIVYNRKKHKWIKFKLSDEANNEACKLFASAIVSKRNVSKYSEIIKYYDGQIFGIFRRLSIVGNKSLRGNYYAGQDYDSEIRFIRSLLRNG